jgi:hypothetical protein
MEQKIFDSFGTYFASFCDDTGVLAIEGGEVLIIFQGVQALKLALDFDGLAIYESQINGPPTSETNRYRIESGIGRKFLFEVRATSCDIRKKILPSW